MFIPDGTTTRKENVLRILHEKGLTITGLCKQIGISKTAFSNWINKNATLSSLETLARALDVEVWELLKPYQDTTPENGLICPHCGKPLHIELTK